MLDSILASADPELSAPAEDFMLGDVEPANAEIGSYTLDSVEPEEIAVSLPVEAPEALAEAEDLSSELAHLGFLGAEGNLEETVVALDAEPEFLGLEIEDSPVEELDLAAEFDRNRERSLSDSSEDDFVFADDGDPLSTKLDLARAYIDMGDDDGARQILEEVLAEGSAGQQQDARELLDRLA